jgi:coiled-coil domain-containing protein 25
MGYRTMSGYVLAETETHRKFHVDNLSSAHVYLRLREGMKWDAIPVEILTDCAQLTKANSIEGFKPLGTDLTTGNKKDNVTVIYTPWSNLGKQASMATGQIGFHRQKQVKKILVEKRVNEIINRLNKTKVEKFPDLAEEKTAFEKEENRKEKAALQEKVRSLWGWWVY